MTCRNAGNDDSGPVPGSMVSLPRVVAAPAVRSAQCLHHSRRVNNGARRQTRIIEGDRHPVTVGLQRGKGGRRIFLQTAWINYVVMSTRFNFHWRRGIAG